MEVPPPQLSPQRLPHTRWRVFRASLNPTLVSYTDAKKHNFPLADAPTSLQAGVFSAVHDRLRKLCNGKEYSPSDVGEPVTAPMALDLEALARRAFEEHEMAIAAEIADDSAPLRLDVPHPEEGRVPDSAGLPTRRSMSDERMTGDDDAISSVSSCWSSEYRVPAGTCPPALATTKDKTGFRRKQRNREHSRKQRRLKREAAELALRQELQARIVDVDERPYVQYRVPKQVALARAAESTTLRIPYSLAQEKQSATGISPANDMGDTTDYKEIEWDGRHTVIILDADGHFVGALLAGPRKGFDQACKNFEAHMHRARLECGMDGEEHNRRGTFATLTSALSMGQDQTEPRNIAPRNARDARAIRKLLKSRSVRQVANFASSWLQIYAQSLHNYYGYTLNELCSHGDAVRRNFKGNVFAGASFNLGPQTVTTTPHRDHLHLPFGLSAVTVFGDFDPKKSAKLKLHELKLLIQVPPHTTYMIMSAIITHSHTPLAEGETRLSFSQYFPGALFRYQRRESMCTQKQFEQEGNEPEPGAERWSKGIRLLRSWATRWQGR